MRIELIIYVSLLLSLLLLLSSLGVPSFSYQVLYACKDLVAVSRIHSVGVNIPCRIGEGKLIYRDAWMEVNGTSYGVVVKGEHWTAP